MKKLSATVTLYVMLVYIFISGVKYVERYTNEQLIDNNVVNL